MPAAVPESVAVVRAVFHVMLNVEGMRMRSPRAAVIVGIAASVIVIAVIAVAGWATTNTWFAADVTVGCTIWIVWLSRAAVPPPAPETTSSRLSAAAGAVKLLYCSPDTTICWPAVKLLVTSRRSVLPPSS